MSVSLYPGRRRAGIESWPQKKPRSHKHRLLNKVQLLGYKLIFAHLGKFAIVAVYYILTQTLTGQHTTIFGSGVTLPDVKGFWDHMFTASTPKGLWSIMPESAWKPMRHVVFRGLLEGVLGVVLYNQIGFNVTKYRQKIEATPPGPFDRLILRSRIFASPYQDHPITGVQFAFLPVMLVLVTVVLGVPLYLGVHYGLAHAAHWSWLEPHLTTHQSLVQKLYVGDYDGLIIGIAVSFAAGRTYRAYLYDNTMFFARSWVARGRRPRWWMPKPTRDLIRDLVEGSRRARAMSKHSGGARFALILGPFVLLGLAGYGYYILQYIA